TDIVREQYQGRVAVQLDLPVETLVRAVRERGSRPIELPKARPVERAGPEIEALKLAVLRRDDVIHRLDEALFNDERNAVAWRALVSTSSVHEAIDVADPDTATLLQRIAVEDSSAEPD